jgi:hypothetical protein
MAATTISIPSLQLHIQHASNKQIFGGPSLNFLVVNSRLLVSGRRLANLLGQDTTLLGSRSASNNSRVAIEVLGNLLERSVSGLDVEFPDDSKFDGKPDTLGSGQQETYEGCVYGRTYVDDVVLPTDVSKGDRVDIVVEEQSQINHQEHDSNTLGTDMVRKNLDGVTDQETRPGRVVEDVVEEDHLHWIRSCSVEEESRENLRQ